MKAPKNHPTRAAGIAACGTLAVALAACAPGGGTSDTHGPGLTLPSVGC